MDNETLIKSIKQLCQNKNISISQLENDLGFSPSLISRWKDKNPNIDRIIDIADYFHVSLDEVVGYNQNLDDEFLNKLYDQTNKKEITWFDAAKHKALYLGVKLYDVETDEYPPQMYDEENYGQLHYVTKYNNGYIIMYAFYKYDSILKPNVLKLFIQPTTESYLVEQKYYQNNLLKLWIKILNSLGDETPDEVKAEEFKNSFINTPENLTNEKIYEILDNPSLMKLIETISTEEFRKVQEIFENPEFKSALQMMNGIQSYLNNNK